MGGKSLKNYTTCGTTMKFRCQHPASLEDSHTTHSCCLQLLSCTDSEVLVTGLPALALPAHNSAVTLTAFQGPPYGCIHFLLLFFFFFCLLWVHTQHVKIRKVGTERHVFKAQGSADYPVSKLDRTAVFITQRYCNGRRCQTKHSSLARVSTQNRIPGLPRWRSG